MSFQVSKTSLVMAILPAASPVPISAQTGGKEFDEAAAELAKRYLDEGEPPPGGTAASVRGSRSRLLWRSLWDAPYQLE